MPPQLKHRTCSIQCLLPHSSHPPHPTPPRQEFLAYYNTTVEEETAGARLAPSCQLYATTILSTVHERAFYEGAPAGRSVAWCMYDGALCSRARGV